MLLGGAQFTISPDPTDGVGMLTILDNGPGDADPRWAKFWSSTRCRARTRSPKPWPRSATCLTPIRRAS